MNLEHLRQLPETFNMLHKLGKPQISQSQKLSRSGSGQPDAPRQSAAVTPAIVVDATASKTATAEATVVELSSSQARRDSRARRAVEPLSTTGQAGGATN